MVRGKFFLKELSSTGEISWYVYFPGERSITSEGMGVMFLSHSSDKCLTSHFWKAAPTQIFNSDREQNGWVKSMKKYLRYDRFFQYFPWDKLHTLREVLP